MFCKWKKRKVVEPCQSACSNQSKCQIVGGCPFRYLFRNSPTSLIFIPRRWERHQLLIIHDHSLRYGLLVNQTSCWSNLISLAAPLYWCLGIIYFICNILLNQIFKKQISLDLICQTQLADHQYGKSLIWQIIQIISRQFLMQSGSFSGSIQQHNPLIQPEGNKIGTVMRHFWSLIQDNTIKQLILQKIGPEIDKPQSNQPLQNKVKAYQEKQKYINLQLIQNKLGPQEKLNLYEMIKQDLMDIYGIPHNQQQGSKFNESIQSLRKIIANPKPNLQAEVEYASNLSEDQRVLNQTVKQEISYFLLFEQVLKEMTQFQQNQHP